MNGRFYLTPLEIILYSVPKPWKKILEVEVKYERNEVKEVIVPTELIKILLGGKWPEDRGQNWEGFGFDEVDCYVMEEGISRLMPSDGFKDANNEFCLVPGPDFELKVIKESF